MEVSSSKWTPELGTDYSSFVHQYQINPLDYSLDEIKFQSFSSERYCESTHKIRSNSNVGSSDHIRIERPAKQLKTNSWNSCTTEQSTPKAYSPSSSSQIISFGNSISLRAISPPGCDEKYTVIPKTEAGSPGNISFPLNSHGSSTQETWRVASTTRRNVLQAQDHVISERKRREKLNQRFIALSALVPGLKKTDKASVVGDAIKYLKQLQERVKILEEQPAKKKMESMIIVKKSHMAIDGETISSDDNFDGQSYQLYLPHVEARVADKDVLIRIHCENDKGALVNILTEIGQLPLTVVHSNAFTFGNSTLDITVVAQMDVKKAITVKEVVKTLRLALLKSM